MNAIRCKVMQIIPFSISQDGLLRLERAGVRKSHSSDVSMVLSRSGKTQYH